MADSPEEFPGIAAAEDTSPGGRQTFVLAQGDEQHRIQALHHEDFGGRTVEEFYGYGQGDGASANTPNDMERSDTSQLFFYEGPRGTSLVIIHDAPEDEEPDPDGGSVTFDFDILPATGDWVVPDDPWEGGFDRTGVDWNWVACCTDGGAYRGGFEGPFWFQLTPHFWRGIDDWVLVDGGGESGNLERIALGKEPITLGSIGKQPTDVEYEVDLSGEVCLPQIDKEFCVTREPAVNIGPRPCESLPSGQTPPLLSVELEYVEFQCEEFLGDCENVRYSRSLWIGSEIRGESCLWIGEGGTGSCTKLGFTCGELSDVLEEGVPDPDVALELASSVLEAAREKFEELQLPSPTGVPYFAIVLGFGVMFLVLAALDGPSPIMDLAVIGIVITLYDDGEEEP